MARGGRPRAKNGKNQARKSQWGWTNKHFQRTGRPRKRNGGVRVLGETGETIAIWHGSATPKMCREEKRRRKKGKPASKKVGGDKGRQIPIRYGL